MEITRNFFESILVLLFPPRCLNCRARIISYENGELCEKCISKITPFAHPFYVKKDMLVFAVASYKNPAIKALIYALKYKKKQPLAAYVARTMAPKISRAIIRDDALIVPIPLHVTKLQLRGFNQAEKIAAELGALLNLPVHEEFLVRTRATKKQSDLRNPKDRLENIKNCFVVPSEYKNELKGKTILLVDDIFTTGTTIFEAEKTLKKAGVKAVHAAVFAKTD
jgi:ComF family protein